MYYEVYLDKLFLENLILDYFLLLMVKQILKYNTTWWRLLLASVLGAAGMCVMVIFPAQNTWIYAVFGFFLLNGGMLLAAFPVRGWGHFIRGFLMLYFSAFLLGGIWGMLKQYIGGAGIYLGAVSYIMLRIIMKCYERYKLKTEYLYDVTLYLNGKSRHVLGLLDTGNQLCQPFTGKPVSIVDYGAISEILEEDMKIQLISMQKFQNGEMKTDKISYIPYHSIGEKNGLLPGLKLDYISIKRHESTQIIGGAVVAVARESVSGKGGYQMILNPSILEN